MSMSDNDKANEMNLPQVVSPAEWESARAELLVKEKEATPLHDEYQ